LRFFRRSAFDVRSFSLASLCLVEICADPILRGADWIVRHPLAVDSRCVRVPLVRAIRRAVAFHGSDVFVLVLGIVRASRHGRLIWSHIISLLWNAHLPSSSPTP
jgi:hypothetical protein